jgi:hypothetical protein
MSPSCVAPAETIAGRVREVRRAVLGVVAWLLMVLAPAACGLEVGEPVILSSVGDPLNVLVALRGSQGPLRGEGCVVTTKRVAGIGDGAPPPGYVRAKLERVDGLLAVRMTTRSPVHAPVFEVVIWAACVQETAVTRAYTLDLRTPAASKAWQQVSSDPGAVAEAPRVDIARPQASPRAAAGVPTPHGEVSTWAGPPDAASLPEAHQQREPRPPAVIGLLVPSGLSLRLSSRLETVRPVPRAGGTNEQVGAAQSEVETAASADAEDGSRAAVAGLEARIRELEASRRDLLQQVSVLQGARGGRGPSKGETGWTVYGGYAAFGAALIISLGTLARGRRQWHPSGVEPLPRRAKWSQPVPPGPSLQVPIAAKDPEPRRMPGAPALTSPEQEGTVAAKEAASPGPASPPATPKVGRDRKMSAPAGFASAGPPVPAGKGDAGTAGTTPRENSPDGSQAAPPAAAQMGAAFAAPDNGAAELTGSFDRQLLEWDHQVKAFRQSLYEAELHLLHDAPHEAVRILTKQVEGPDAEFVGVEPWTMLFHIYRQRRERAAFDALTARFRKRFNIAPPEWEPPPDAGAKGAVGLAEQFPHVLERITATWPSQECLRYLNGLFLDDRGGTRQGFSLEVAGELELLRNIMQARIGQVRVVGPQSPRSGTGEEALSLGLRARGRDA